MGIAFSAREMSEQGLRVARGNRGKQSPSSAHKPYGSLQANQDGFQGEQLTSFYCTVWL